jgi:hypothetical protein
MAEARAAMEFLALVIAGTGAVPAPFGLTGVGLAAATQGAEAVV